MRNERPSRTRMMREIDEVSFVISDLILFLNTHPCDKEALACFEKMSGKRNELLKEYAGFYGPLTIDTAADSCGDTWKWMEQPFPWESKGGCR